MIKIVIMTLIGGAMLALGVWSLRTRAYNTHISTVEAAILKAGGEAPLPLSAGDRTWGRAQAWLTIAFGGTAFALGALILANDLFVSE